MSNGRDRRVKSKTRFRWFWNMILARILTGLSTLPVIPGVSRFWSISSGLYIRASNLHGISLKPWIHGHFNQPNIVFLPPPPLSVETERVRCSPPPHTHWHTHNITEDENRPNLRKKIRRPWTALSSRFENQQNEEYKQEDSYSDSESDSDHDEVLSVTTSISLFSIHVLVALDVLHKGCQIFFKCRGIDL